MNANLGKPIARSALHEIHAGLGARLVDRRGWWVPEEYGAPATELAAARTELAVGEQCGTVHMELVGKALPEAIAARWKLGDLLPGTAASLPAEDLIPPANAPRFCRLTRTSARIVIPPRGNGHGNLHPSQPHRVDAAQPAPAAGEPLVDGPDLQHVDLSSGLTTLLVAGPRSPDLLAGLVRLDLHPDRFADRRVVQTGAAGVPLFLLRWDRGPVLAFDLAVGRDVAEYFWAHLVRSGAWTRVTLIGAAAMEELG